MDSAGIKPPKIPDKLDSPVSSVPSPVNINLSVNSPTSIKLSSKGVENAKKRLRAFSIQKKTPITPIAVPKPSGTGNTTVLIGKLSSVKTTHKPNEESDIKKPPKPPKPGTTRKAFQDFHSDLQKRTLAEIEDMKRKMELVELGIPLGLICPTATSEKAMPTKAMPPIKSFLDNKSRVVCQQRKCISGQRVCCPEKLDEIIREAKKARDEGRKFKFDYQKLLPDYDNPFQKKKEEPPEKDRHQERRKSDYSKEDRRSDKYDYKKHSDYRKHDKDKYRHKERDKSKSEHKKSDKSANAEKETDVNLNDYLVCDSWSLENEDKTSTSSPKVDKLTKTSEPSEIVKASIAKKNEMLKQCAKDSPKNKKIEKLQPVIDSFKYEIDPNDDEVLDIFDEKLELDSYAHRKAPKPQESPSKRSELDNDLYKDISDMNDDTFLESVINEIKQEGLSEDECNEKGLVEYDISPPKDDTPKKRKRSATPDIEDWRESQRSDYSGYTSTDSYRTADTSESGYKSVESISSNRMSPEKELEGSLQQRLSKSTVDSLETWSFILKVCQPLLFRHDKNKCYKETLTSPKLWYTANPRRCSCVKDRLVVYEELESCKMKLVDRVYGCDQIPESPHPMSRNWYPRAALCPTESVPLTNEWEADDSQGYRERGTPLKSQEVLLESQGYRERSAPQKNVEVVLESQGYRERGAPQKSEEVLLDREYQRFMEAVESKVESSRSTTPVQLEVKKTRKEEAPREPEKKVKKINTEDWSQESEIEVEVEKSKKLKEKPKSKLRKRKRSSSTQSSPSESEDSKKKSKAIKKKAMKKVKSKSAKRRRIGRKILKKLKEKEKKKKKHKDSDDDIEEEKKRKDKKAKKKKQLKLKKKISKKKKSKAKSSSSSDSYSSDSYSSESESESDRKSKKAKKKSQELKKKKSKKRKQSTSDSTQSEELFDVNILKNIKTERLTDDEEKKKLMDFSPRRQKPREIINVKELQNDFVGNNIEIKKEIEEIIQEEPTNIDLEETSVEETAEPEKKQETEAQAAETCKSDYEARKFLEGIKLPEAKNQPVKRASDFRASSEALTSPDVRTLPEARIPPEAKAMVESRVPLESGLPAARFLPVPRVLESRTLQQVPEPKLETIQPDVRIPEDMSQSSSQESVISIKDPPSYEKDDSFLRPSSQNSNYNFHDVLSAHTHAHVSAQLEHTHTLAADDDKYPQYEGYEMYEHMAMAYQSDVASQAVSPGGGSAQRIETVVHARSCGEIKCDWRPGAAPARTQKSPRPSRWGLKPGEVNIVLTGGSEPEESPPEVFQIPSLANRTEVVTGYDEAYLDMYGAADRLQYGDCFSEAEVGGRGASSANITVSGAPSNVRGAPSANITVPTSAKLERTSTLDARIDQALRDSILGEVTKEAEEAEDTPDKGILVNCGVPPSEASRALKRVSFADGYTPGQDSDVEEPPVKKRKKSRRTGCAWPCPASHPDHVPLWDALPPPPPPPGSPPRGIRAMGGVTAMCGATAMGGVIAPQGPRLLTPGSLIPGPGQMLSNMPLPLHGHQFDPSMPLSGFIPSEPPPTMIALH